MIKVDLITGFLGSGKTTFLLKYARYLMDKGLKIGILEYDYGSVNVDMLLLNKLRGPLCELEMLAAACDEDCLKRRFKTKLIAMAMSGYDRVIIEPSGVFDMDMFFDDLRDDPLDQWYEIGSIITVVNANLEDNLSKEEEYLLASQAAGAGCILLSRTQLFDKAAVENTKEHIKKACEAIKCKGITDNYMEKDWAEFTSEDYEKLMNAGYVINDYVKIVAGSVTDFSSVCYLDIPFGLKALKKKISVLFSDPSYGNVLRVKGFIVDGGVSHAINATRHEFLDDIIAIGHDVLIVTGTALNKSAINDLMK